MKDDSSSFSQARRRIEAAYDPALLRIAGHKLIDLLAQHFARLQMREGPVLNWSDPVEAVRAASTEVNNDQEFTEANEQRDQASRLLDRFAGLVRQTLAHGQNLHHPRYIGHQVSASLPLAGLFDAIASMTNQGMAIYEMGPWATAAEQAMIDILGRQIGFPAGSFAGAVTSGGSLANLTSLLTARNVILADAWQQGVRVGEQSPVIVVHAEAHYSVVRTAGIMGIGTNRVIRAALDDKGRMSPTELDTLLATLRKNDRKVIAVCAAACATHTGAFDPLDQIANVCERHKTWLHVDAAHGGAACLSDRHRHVVKGLHRADSVVWDAHKMLFMPALCAYVFYKNPAHRFAAFQQDAPYLFDESNPGLADYDSALRTVECTKRAAAFGLWGAWAMFGKQLFADMVDTTFEMGQRFYHMLEKAPDFEPLHEPQCNIVVFRYMPDPLRTATPQRIGEFQLQLRQMVIQSGRFYIVPSKDQGHSALRVTIMNPLTTAQDLTALQDEIRRLGVILLGNETSGSHQIQDKV